MKATAIRWAIHPAEIARIEQLPGISEFTAKAIPAEGDMLTHPFLVDPKTQQPVPLRVAHVLHSYPEPNLVTVVVSRPQ